MPALNVWVLRVTAAIVAGLGSPHPSVATSEPGPTLVVHAEAVRAGVRTTVAGAVDIDAPACAVWAVLATCDRAPSIMAGVQSCRLLARDTQAGRWETRELVGRHPLLPWTERSVVHVEFAPPSVIKFTAIGGDLDEVEAEWTIEPLGERRTRASYAGQAVAPIHAPSQLVRLVARHDAARTLAAVRRQAATTQCDP